MEMMRVNGVEVEDTFAEAFRMWGCRVIITAKNQKWADTAAMEMTGFATSVIMCDCEAGIERRLSEDETPDGRPGTAVIVFAHSKKTLIEPLVRRIGQCVLTCPTTAVYNGIPEEEADAMLDIGKRLRFFGDGYQVKMRLGDGWLRRRRFWRIPVMEGEFLIEEMLGAKKGVGGGNFIIMGVDEDSTLEAAERAVEAIHRVPGVITPFPGGLCRSGSKVGSRYPFLRASTNTPFCPAIKHTYPESQVPEGVNSIIEVVLNGLDEASIRRAMAEGIKAAVEVEGVKRITAVNFGGKLGKYQIYLRDCLGGEVS